MVNVTTKATTKKKNPLLDKTNANNPIIAAATAGIDTGGVTQAQLDEAQRAGINVMSPKNVKLMSRLDKEALARQTAAEGAAGLTIDQLNAGVVGQNQVTAADINKSFQQKASEFALKPAELAGNAITGVLEKITGQTYGRSNTAEMAQTDFGSALSAATLGVGIAATIGVSIAVTGALAASHVGILSAGLIGGQGLSAVKSLISSDDATNVFRTAESDSAQLITAVRAGEVLPDEALRRINEIQDYTNDEVRSVKLTTTYNPVLWIDGGKKILIKAQKTQNSLADDRKLMIQLLATQAAQNAVNQLGA